MKFDIITIFPHIFDSYFNESILKRAQDRKKIKISIHNLRDFVFDKHRTVDDKPYGGGAGMVMKAEPIWKAVSSLVKFRAAGSSASAKLKQMGKKTKIILLTPRGRTFNQATARRYAKLERIIFICGRYEGLDERISKFCDEEISVGDYVLTGGELPAMTIVDAVARLLPGVIAEESLEEESFSQHPAPNAQRQLEYPQYTRPEVFCPKKGVCWKVPKVLLSGDHQKIAEWRERYGKIDK